MARGEALGTGRPVEPQPQPRGVAWPGRARTVSQGGQTRWAGGPALCTVQAPAGGKSRNACSAGERAWAQALV